MTQLEQLLDEVLNENLSMFSISKPSGPVSADTGGTLRIRLRPLRSSDRLLFQAEEYTKTQVFHKNLTSGEAKAYVLSLIPASFLQAQVQNAGISATVLANRRGTVTVKIKRSAAPSVPTKITLEHNRRKHYLLEEGMRIPFLQKLGVMTADGKVVHARYDKFRQINRFLEFIDDILPELPRDRELRILDFGCGKSYLTFAIYYYFHEIRKQAVRITGLDLKADVIEDCRQLAAECGYNRLEFLCGDIADYDGCDAVDMVVTLHACDTATDYALAKAVGWGAKVILSVPCCQHELNRQISNDLLAPVLSYGILKERISALLTDGIRARLLEEQGYSVQLLEFIDMEHTPKNILIRAVKTAGQGRENPAATRLIQSLHADLTLEKLLREGRAENAAPEG